MDEKKTLYGGSFLVVFVLMMLGFIIELISGDSSISMPAFPVNLIILLLFIAYLISTYLFFKDTEIIRWFTGIPITIAVISAYTFLTLIMGFVAQVPHNHFIDNIGLTNIKESYPFMIMSLLMLMVLGYTIIRRVSRKLTLRNFAFFLNHFGLFLVISAGSIGTGDMIRLSMPIEEGEITDMAFTRDNKAVRLPFSIKLNDFKIDEYPPELIVYNRSTGEAIIAPGSKKPFVKKDKTGNLYNLDFKVLDYIEFAAPTDSSFVASDKIGTVHAALLELSDNNKTDYAWVSTGNFMHDAEFFFFDEKFVVGISDPKVLKYQSNINLIKDNKPERVDILVEVNKPVRFNNWKIYQNSYDARFGRWSQVSIFELIKDPWLPVVYVGIFMLLFGSVYLIYAGRKTLV